MLNDDFFALWTFNVSFRLKYFFSFNNVINNTSIICWTLEIICKCWALFMSEQVSNHVLHCVPSDYKYKSCCYMQEYTSTNAECIFCRLVWGLKRQGLHLSFWSFVQAIHKNTQTIGNTRQVHPPQKNFVKYRCAAIIGTLLVNTLCYPPLPR